MPSGQLLISYLSWADVYPLCGMRQYLSMKFNIPPHQIPKLILHLLGSLLQGNNWTFAQKTQHNLRKPAVWKLFKEALPMLHGKLYILCILRLTNKERKLWLELLHCHR